MMDILLNMVASGGVAAGCVGALNPLDTVRIRWQCRASDIVMEGAWGAAAGNGITSFSRAIIARQGLWTGLWSPGLVPNCSAILLSTGFRLGIYPTLRDAISGKEKSAFTMWISGLIPGLFSYGGITPLYLVKTHLQLSAGQPGGPIYRSTVHGLSSVYAEGGIRHLYRGVLSLMLRGGMLSSGQTLGYDLCKTEAKKRGVEDGFPLHLCASVASAATATVSGMPADVVFTNYSSAPPKKYRSVFHCAASLLKEEGPLVFYRGSSAFFMRSAPIFTLYFPIYEQVRKQLGLGFMS
jgi:hypothetical protein